MFTNLSGLEGALIGLAVLVFFIVRQFTTRSVTSRWSVLAPLVLAYFGLQGLGQLDTTGWALLGVNLSLGVGLGFLRGMTFRVWANEYGQALMSGTSLTLMLWLVTLGMKVGLTLLAYRFGLGAQASGNAETMLPAAATIAAQTLVVYLRAQDRRLATAA